MNTINLIVELGPETQAKLDQILEALKANKPNCHSCVESAVFMTKNLAERAAAAAPAQERTTDAAAHPVDEVSPHGTPEPVAEPEPLAEPEPAKPQYTPADILAVVQRLIGPGSAKREQAKAIVNDYATKISAIPAEKYDEVMDRLMKLEKGS